MGLERIEAALTLKSIRAVVIDMDGVLWRGDVPLPGMADLFIFLKARGLRYVMASNNSSKSPADYVQKFARLGVAGIGESHFVTSGTATVDFLRVHYPAETRVHVLGGPGLKAMVSRWFELTEDAAGVVVVGLDVELTYDKLRRAALLIRGGADFIGTNDDATFPSPEGLVPGTGSLIAALIAATGHTPRLIGKPDAPMFETSLRVLGTPPGETLMIGDRLNTDVAGASAVGLKTALVLTGVTTPDELALSPLQPDFVFDSLPHLMASWDTDLSNGKMGL